MKRLIKMFATVLLFCSLALLIIAGGFSWFEGCRISLVSMVVSGCLYIVADNSLLK